MTGIKTVLEFDFEFTRFFPDHDAIRKLRFGNIFGGMAHQVIARQQQMVGIVLFNRLAPLLKARAVDDVLRNAFVVKSEDIANPIA